MSLRPPAHRAVPNRLREVRQTLGLTQEEVARRAGVATLTVKRIEQGFPAQLATARALQHALGVGSIDILFPDAPAEEVAA